MTISLRTRLALWFGLAVLLITFLVTFVTEKVTVWNVEKGIEDSLEKRAGMVAALISSDITTSPESYAQVTEHLAEQEFSFVPLLLRITDSHGKVISEFGDIPDPLVQNLDYQLQLPDVDKGRFDSISFKGMESLRLYTISVSDPRTQQTLAFVQAGESLAQVDNARRDLWQNAIIVGLGSSLLVIAVGLVLIWRGFHPLNAILNAINEADYNRLKARLREESRPAELQQLAKSLTAMWQRLDRAVSQRQKFIGNIAHDIRTPLTTLQGQLEVLLLQPSLTAEVKDSLERMLKETHRVVRLVKNLLLNVQLESGPTPVTEDVNLKELLDEVVGDIWALAEGLQLSVVAPRDVGVYGDRDLLKQMLLNIVDNAIKFTPKGGKVELKLTSEGGWAVMEVSDTGRGIPSDELPHVTKAFYKPTTSRRPIAEGTRLGLSIVKQVAELHGGQLEIRSREKLGTSVIVRLPRRLLIVLPERK